MVIAVLFFLNASKKEGREEGGEERGKHTYVKLARSLEWIPGAAEQQFIDTVSCSWILAYIKEINNLM